MAQLRKIEHFKFHYVSPDLSGREGQTYQHLKDIFETVTNYLLISSKNSWEIPHRMSLRDAINEASLHLGLVSLWMSNNYYRFALRTPLIARNKGDNELALLLPHGKKYYVQWKPDGKNPIFKLNELLNDFDELVQIFPVANEFSHKYLTRLLPKRGLFLVALTLIIGLFVALYSAFYNLQEINLQNRIVLITDALIGCGLVIILFGFARWLSVKNYGVSVVGFFYGFYLQLFLQTTERLSTLQLAEIARLADSLRSKCKKQLVTPFLLFAAQIYLVAFLFNAWLYDYTAFLWLLVFDAIVLLLAYLIEKRWASSSPAKQAFIDVALKLEGMDQSLNSLIGLRAMSPTLESLCISLKRLMMASEKSIFLRFISRSLYFLLPMVAFVYFAFFYSFSNVPILPWHLAICLPLILFNAFALIYVAESFGRDPKRFSFQFEIKPKTEHVQPVNIHGAIELAHLSFAYPNSPTLILKNLNLYVEPGSFCVVHGPAGAGKTTLLRVLMGDLLPLEGEVIIDGQDIRGLKEDSLKSNFGVIFDDASLFSGSVYDNIMCGRDLPKRSIEKLLLSHAIFDCLIDLPLSQETYINFRGRNVSHLESFIIFLARALIHEPKFLFIDDGLYAFSAPEQKLLWRYLSDLPMTRIITSNNAISGIPHQITEIALASDAE